MTNLTMITKTKTALALFGILTGGSFDTVYQEEMSAEKKKKIIYVMQTRVAAFIMARQEQFCDVFEWKDMLNISEMDELQLDTFIAHALECTYEDVRAWWKDGGQEWFNDMREAEKLKAVEDSYCYVVRVDDAGFLKADTSELVQTPKEATGWSLAYSRTTLMKRSGFNVIKMKRSAVGVIIE